MHYPLNKDWCHWTVVSYSKPVKSLSGPCWYSVGATEFVFRYCLMYLCTDFRWWRANLISLCSWTHRRLQSCVGTQARLGYARFDVQLQRILSLHCTLYVHLCVCKHTYAIYRGLGACHMSSHPVLVIWERKRTRACRGLWLNPG